jgi:hypothetical protein
MPTLIARPPHVQVVHEAVRIHVGTQQGTHEYGQAIRIVESKNLAAHFLISEGTKSTAVVLCSFEQNSEAENRDPLPFLAPLLQDIEATGNTFGAERSICLV